MNRSKILILQTVFFSFVAMWGATISAKENNQPYVIQRGPIDAKLGDQAVLKLPAGYGFLGSQEAQRALKDMGNFPSGRELGLVLADSEEENWFVVISYVDAGFVKDEEAENWDADALLSAIKAGTEDQNKKRQEQGIPPLIIRGWEEKPHYDKINNKVVWAMSHKEADSLGVNYNTLALGRQGYISMNMVGELSALQSLKPHTEVLLKNLNFIDGKRYADFNRNTDKVAAVGLTALIAGAAVKTGLLAKLWAFMLPMILVLKKLIIFLVIGVGTLLAKLFRKKSHAAPQA